MTDNTESLGEGIAPDRLKGRAPGPGDVVYDGSNVDTMPYSAEPFRPPEHVSAPDIDPKRPSGTEGRGHGIETIVPTADARAEHSAGTFEHHEPTHAEPDPGYPQGRAGGVLLDPPSAHPMRTDSTHSDSTHTDSAHADAGHAEAAPSDSTPTGSVPAGREGVDAGAVDAMGVEGTASSDVEANSQNHIAGIGPRDAGDVTTGGEGRTDPGTRDEIYEPSASNAAGDVGSDPQSVRDANSHHKAADPDIPGVPDAVGPGGNGVQTGVRQDLNTTTISEQQQGIVVQMQGDLQTGRAPAGSAREVLIQRLTEAGLPTDDVDTLLRRVQGGDAPTDVDSAQPGTGQ